MRDFWNGGSTLKRSSLPLRVTLSWFLLFIALGYASNFALLAWKTGLTPSGISHYYRGYEPPAGSDQEFQYPKEWRELAENTHFHIYIVPILLLVLTHVFFLTAWSQRAKLWTTSLVYGAALADLAAPWLVRYGGAAFAWWKLVSAISYHALLFFLLAACFWDAWGKSSGSAQPTQRESL